MVAIAPKPLPKGQPAAGWLRLVFALDVRGLACLRIGFAAILLWDLAVRSLALEAHYTDAGLLPRGTRMGLAWDYNEPWWMSFHMLSGEPWWQAALFVVAAIAAGFLLVGYQTRWMTVASWLLLVSLHGRNPLVLQGGDVLLRCLLFWAIFVPLGACWSVDAWRAKATTNSTPADREISSPGTAAIIVQLACIYFFTALLKTAPSWRTDFSAVYYALSGDHYTTPLGYALLHYPRLLAVLTASSWLLEWCGPLLLLAPIGQRWVRTLVPLAMIGFHLGLVLTMTIGTFPWICIVAWAALLPPAVWNLFGTRPTPSHASPVPSNKPTVVGTLVVVLLVLVVLLNIKRLNHPHADFAPPFSFALRATGLRQYWNMFSPGPAEWGGWLRIEGKTADGQLVNLFQPGEPLPDSQPALVSAMYPTQHWRRSLVTLWEYADPPYRQSVLDYFVRLWNESHPPDQQIVQARLVQMIEPTPPQGSDLMPAAGRKVLAKWPQSLKTLAAPLPGTIARGMRIRW